MYTCILERARGCHIIYTGSSRLAMKSGVQTLRLPGYSCSDLARYYRSTCVHPFMYSRMPTNRVVALGCSRTAKNVALVVLEYCFSDTNANPSDIPPARYVFSYAVYIYIHYTNILHAINKYTCTFTRI